MKSSNRQFKSEQSNNRTALIFGGARMGVQLAEELGRRGFDVVISYRTSKSSALQSERRLKALGRTSFIVQSDMTKERDVARLMSKIRTKMGRLDLLINLSSTYVRTPWNKLTTKQWCTELDNNLKGAFLSVLYAAPLLRKVRGRVIHFSDWISASGRPRYREFVPYYTAKTAVLGLTQAQALELAPHVLVNAIAPGPIIPPKGASTSLINSIVKETPLKKWGGVKEIIKAILFLIDTDFVTGECIRVDGGRHLY